jgi:hypothetical protein
VTVDLASLGITYIALAISDQRGILSYCLRLRRHQPKLCKIVRCINSSTNQDGDYKPANKEPSCNVPKSKVNDSMPLLNRGLVIQCSESRSSHTIGEPISMPPRHRPIRSEQARSTSTNQTHDGEGLSRVLDTSSTVTNSINVRPQQNLFSWSIPFYSS